MKNRLFIVEGMPCSGKSTTSAFVADILKESWQQVVFVDEGGGNHPADYEFHAYLTDAEFLSLPQEYQRQIKQNSIYNGSGYIAALSDFAGDIFDVLLQHKIYDFLPWEIERPVMLEKWRSFVDGADEESIYVFNCCFLQNPMCETMMRFGFEQNVSREYIGAIYDIIAPLSPMVIYLKNDDIAECVRKTAAERDGWLEAVTDYHTNGGYGRSIGAAGFDGYIACLAERQRRELSILSELGVDTLVLENAHRDWPSAYEQIKKIL